MASYQVVCSEMTVRNRRDLSWLADPQLLTLPAWHPPLKCFGRLTNVSCTFVGKKVANFSSIIV
jgi:hypothetical protein